MNFTPSQRKALSLHRHLAILANAGSGKTRVLVHRYVDLLEALPELSPRNVVAITFTESAAAELRTKISREVNDRLAAAEEPERRLRLAQVRDALPNAFLGTIHAFASRILHSYPVEANVDASFAILQGADQRILQEDAVTRVFYSVLEEAYAQPDAPPVLRSFRALGRSAVTGMVREMLGNRSRVERLGNGLYARTNEEVVSFWFHAIRESLEGFIGEESRSCLRELLSSLNAGKRGKTSEEAKSAIEEYLAATDFLKAIVTYREALGSIFTSGKVRKKITSDLTKSDSLSLELLERLEGLAESAKAVLPVLEVMPPTVEALHAVLAEQLAHHRVLFDLYRQVLEEYSQTKHDYGMLDFDDLIFRLQRLLEDSRIREELSRQFRFLMIDEFQDTDETQYELARLLTENFGTRNNLAVVGDPKQSIYTFRNADATIFQKTREVITAQSLNALAEAESLTLQLQPDEEKGEIWLRESFRMTKGPMAIVNRIFRQVMRVDAENTFGGSEVEYSDLVLGRAAALNGRVEFIAPIVEAKSKKPDPEQEGEDLELESSSEAELVARKIQHILANPETYSIEESGDLRAPQYRDIAILLRARTHLAIFEQALRDANIPYVVSKGAGFFSQQEITDIFSYLQFLIVPTRDVALTAILRSPFFALSDTDLFQVAFHGKTARREQGASLWEQLVSYSERTSKPHIKRAVLQISQNLKLIGRTGAALLVEKIFAETGIYATLAAGINGAQKIANLEKFLALARDSDSSGFSSIFDFVDRIQYLIEENEKESQADVSSTENAVKITTVHTAKGLEYGIVIVPSLEKQFNFDNGSLIDKELGLTIKGDSKQEPTLMSRIINLRSRHATKAEEKRIFYVALTRARDHLILSGTIKPSLRESWLQWLIGELPALAVPETREIRLVERIERYDAESGNVFEEEVELTMPVYRSLADMEIPESAPTDASSREIGDTHLFPLTILHPRDRFSATQFLTLRECPTKYHLSYILGVPEEPKLAYDMEADEYSEKVQGRLLGQVVHSLCDRIDIIAPAGILNEERFAAQLDTIFFTLSISDEAERREYAKASHKHVLNLLRSDLARDLFATADHRTEYPVQAQLPSGDILYGIIDRLYLDADGTWTILDYKTDSRKTRSKYAAQKRARYEFQLRFYAYLVSLHFTGTSKVNAVLFYTEDGSSDLFTFDVSSFETLARECTDLIETVRHNEKISSLMELDRNLEHCSECNFYDGLQKRCVVLSAGSEADRKTGKIAELV